MNKKHCIAGIVAATSVLSMGGASAGLLNGGSIYQMTIDTGTSYLAMGASPAFMTDNQITFNGTTYGVGGDGHAGVITFQTDGTGENLVVTSFQIDPILGTAGGAFFQYANDLSMMSGTVDSAGNMTLDLTGRMGLAEFFSDPVSSLGAQPWNIGSGTSSYEQFTSGQACNNTVANCLTGSAVTPSGIPNEFKVTLVSAGEIGAAWGFFDGTPYSEVWDSQNTITLLGTVPAVPIPASIWLFASGLIGLIGFAKRKQTT